MCIVFMKVKIVQLIILCSSAFNYNYAQTCVPCEEHTQCKVSTTYSNKENKATFLIWKFDGIGRAICYTSGYITCHPYPGVDPNLKFSIQSGSGNTTTEVSILNTTRAGNALPLEKRWELVAQNQEDSSRLIYTCDFKLYNKVSKIHCSHEASNKGLRVKCTVSPVYPKIACDFKFNEERYDRKTVYNVTRFNQDPLLYTTECYVDIPVDVLTPGRIDYNVSTWPDVNMYDVILKAGLIVKGHVTLEQPKLSFANCPDTIQVGTYHHCICSRDDNSDIKTWIYWNTNTENTTNFDRTAVLREFKTNIDPVEYTCTAKNELGWMTIVKYHPVIKSNDCPLEKPYNCSTECYGDDEFCLKGVVNSCQSASSDTSIELCRILTKRVSEEIKTDQCKDVCKSRLNNFLQEERNDIIPLLAIILSSCGVIAIIFLILLILLRYRRKKKKSICFDKHDNSNLRKNSRQDFLMDCKAHCNSQLEKVPLIPVFLLHEELGECSEPGKHKHFILCTEYVKNPDFHLKKYNVLCDILISKKFILCGINLTVRLFVDLVSEERPQQLINENRGEPYKHTGTGRIVNVLESSEYCRCPKHIKQMEIQKWIVSIATTTHIVFDESEAKCTTAELLISDNGIEVCKALKEGVFKKCKNVRECIVQYSICDEDLSNLLISILKEQRELLNSLSDKNDTFFVISHPHGRSKHICFSRLSRNIGFSTVACPGSYGASILTLHNVPKAQFPVHLGIINDNGFSTACQKTDVL